MLRQPAGTGTQLNAAIRLSDTALQVHYVVEKHTYSDLSQRLQRLRVASGHFMAANPQVTRAGALTGLLPDASVANQFQGPPARRPTHCQTGALGGFPLRQFCGQESELSAESVELR